ncbi:MAG: hypothetical protein DME54_02155 [Verrucomicrobia bacterium]|nr:MAG: hypothetical protein DME54_02155 [Verrucomicrobiota bacterium]
MKTSIPPVLVTIALVCFALSPICQAQDQNTRFGVEALTSNNSGDKNTAIGFKAMHDNRSGSLNTATGFRALFSNTTGTLNAATGESALQKNINGSLNTANGAGALGNNIDGRLNVAIGTDALSLNRAGDANTIRIGTQGTQKATYIAGIAGARVVFPAAQVYATIANGQLGTVTSSQRFKDDIRPMEKVSEAIYALKPVTFHYKRELDPEGTSQFGLVAEDVEKVNPDLVVRDEKGEIYSVRYDQVNAMLLNEFLKEHRRMEEQDKRIEELTAQLKEQASQIQKVSAQLEASKPATRMVNNP